MCGITGFVNLDGQAASEDEIRRMVALIRHRGPDGEGHWLERNVALGHTRLAIIDLHVESNQPFHSADGRYVLTFNGEIFNYIELRQELEQLGCRFRTQSDTEVLLQAFVTWGDACVPRFNGMCAFAVYDRVEDRLFCSRDRFGVKPFVYARQGNRFLFGSEIKPLLAVCPELRRPDYAAISHCMRQSLSGGLENTCFLGVRRLLPAHNLVLHRGELVFQRYWDYPKTADLQLDYESATELILKQLDDSVRIRMRSDVPVGITLSSGLDSTAIAHLMRRHSDQTLHAFTSSYEELESEAGVAAETSRGLGLDFHAVTCDPGNLLEKLKLIVRHIETPHASPPILPLWDIMQAASRRVKVLLEGQGSDEMFAGYLPIYFSHAVFQALRRGQMGEAWRILSTTWAVTSQHKLLGRRYFFSNLLRSMIPGSHGLIRRFGRGDELVYTGPLKDIPDFVLPVDREFDDLLNQRLGTAHSVELVDLLHYGDAISMAFGIESRVPFLDYRLVESVFRTPGSFKLGGGIAKRILRSAVRGFVPAEILENRNKQGFTTPISTWFRQAPDDTINEVLLSERCLQRGLFEPRRMRKTLEQHLTGKRDHGPVLFRWLTCELWFREFIDGPAA